MIASERFEKIVQIVDENGIANTRDLARMMDVTETTIRRDCEELEKQGKLLRVHGGAKRVNHKSITSNRDEKDVRERTEHYEEKCKVCEKAASFIQDGDCIFLDGGTSVVPILQYLKEKSVKIVTHSLLVAEAFRDLELDAELFLIGGHYVKEYNMSVGPVALGDLSRFNFDHAFLGCAGLDIEKQLVYTTEVETMMIKEKAMEQSVKNYLLIDSSKLSVRGFYSFVESTAFDAVICNQSEELESAEIPENVIIVE